MKPVYKLSPQVVGQGARLGCAPERVPLLLLAPLVQVAWAEGFVQPAERRTILRFAENFGLAPGQTAYAELDDWLDERPSDEFFDRAAEKLRELLEALPAKAAARLRNLLHFGCLEVAQAAGDIGLLRGRSNIRREEREHLREISDRLGLTPVAIYQV